MLVIKVKEGDYIMLGEDIRIEIVKDLSADYVKLGIEAPKSLRILRSKHYEKELAKDAEANADELKELEERRRIREAEVLRIKEQEARYKERERERKKKLSVT